jgi:hypothetical protein
MMYGYKKAHAEAEFPCFGASMDSPTVPVLLDWDDWRHWSKPLMVRVRHDLTLIAEAFPAVGEAALYKTGHGVHAVFQHELPMSEYSKLLDMVQAEACGYGVGFSQLPNTNEASVCAGFAWFAQTDGPTLRVGCKGDRPHDIMRISPRSITSPIIATHDAMLRHYRKVARRQERS